MMTKLSACLLALALVVVFDASFARYAGRYNYWGQIDGSHYASEKCSTRSSILPTPQSGCCGKHATNKEQADVWSSWNNGFRAKRSTEQDESEIPPDKYITDGTPTGLRQYPWLVHLVIKIRNSFLTSTCGGSLISDRFVLTAAHCVTVDYRSYDDVSIVMAEYDTRLFPTDCVGSACVQNVVMHPEEIMIHEEFYLRMLYNDIALLRLSGSAPYSEYIRPICLPPFNIDNPGNEGAPLTVTGWGAIGTGRQESPIKLAAQMRLVPQTQCRRYYRELDPGQICAVGLTNGQDHCQGDSGGPLMAEYKGNFYVVGIVSGKDNRTYCGSSVPSLYTNVFAYTNWIKEKMGHY